MTPTLSGHFSIFGLVFFVLKSLLGIARQWSLEKFAILTLKPRSRVRILIYRTWAILTDMRCLDASDGVVLHALFSWYSAGLLGGRSQVRTPGPDQSYCWTARPSSGSGDYIKWRYRPQNYHLVPNIFTPHPLIPSAKTAFLSTR